MDHLIILTKIAANATDELSKLPFVKYDVICDSGKKYKKDCNTCHCVNGNQLICSKAACLDPPNNRKIRKNHIKKLKNKSKFEDIQDNSIDKKKEKGRVVRKGSKRYLKQKSGSLSSTSSQTCVAGRIYSEGCRRCFCNADRTLVCSDGNACEQLKATPDLVPEDVRPSITDKEYISLPVLNNSASVCSPGRTYKVDCNVCICNEFQNLMCDKLLCISFPDIHKAEADKLSGLPCNKDNYEENDVLRAKCVECTCNGTTHCQVKTACKSELEVSLRSSVYGRNSLAFNYTTTKKCTPDHIYNDACNKCYCQPNGTLRCTQKICLNYRQAVYLEKQQQYLLEHGL